MKALLLGTGLLVVLVIGSVGTVSGPPLALKQIVQGAVITQEFGCTPFELEPYDESCATRHFHSGIDLAAPEGTPVHAAAAGVAHVVDGPGYGMHVFLRHDARTQTLYGHLSSILVTEGQAVGRGQVLALVGSTGMSTGPHLHFEVRVDQVAINPRTWLAG